MYKDYKRLKTINEDDYGFQGYAEMYGRKGVEIFVNLQRIWNEAQKSYSNPNDQIDLMIQEFEAIHTHELLHWILRCNYKTHPKWELGEELMIWTLMEEKLTARQVLYYLDDIKYDKPCRRRHVGDKGKKKKG